MYGYERFGVVRCFHFQDSASDYAEYRGRKLSLLNGFRLPMYQCTRCHIPENWSQHRRCCRGLRSWINCKCLKTKFLGQYERFRILCLCSEDFSGLYDSRRMVKWGTVIGWACIWAPDEFITEFAGWFDEVHVTSSLVEHTGTSVLSKLWWVLALEFFFTSTASALERRREIPSG